MIRFLIFLLVLGISACTPKTTKTFVSKLTVQPSADKSIDVCNQRSSYIPDPDHLSHTPQRHIKVNFHFMRNSAGKCNFSEEEGIKHVKTVIGAANENMWQNKQMLLPPDNNTPAIPTRYKYVLTPDPSIPDDDGIYFHDDDDYYFFMSKGKGRNNYDKGVFDKYGIQKDEVLNVFVQDHHIDSLKSTTYKQSMAGIAFNTWVKCSMWYSNMQEVVMKNGKATHPRQWLNHKQMNHEIGHVLGLRHTWRGNDGCDDTPNHPNCWGRTETPPCNEYSNNVMDYNPLRNAWTPCQLGIVHHSLTQKDVKRKLLVQNWCSLNKKPIVIKEKIEWNSCKDLESHIIIEDGGELTIRCRVSLPKDAKIEILQGGTLIVDGGRLHNDCGDQWQGIEVWKVGRKEGQVILMNDAKIEHAKHPILIENSK